jgi:hypothetical protein
VSVEYENVAALARGNRLPVTEVLRAATATVQAAYPVGQLVNERAGTAWPAAG